MERELGELVLRRINSLQQRVWACASFTYRASTKM